MRISKTTKRPILGHTEMASALSAINFDGRSEKIVGSNGELNAGSRAELSQNIFELAGLINSGRVHQETAAASQATARQRYDALVEAYNDPSGRRFVELGAALSGEIQTRLQRLGFTRRILSQGEVAQGSIPRIRVVKRNVEAVVATGPTQVAVQIVQDNYLYPNEFYNIANVRVETREIAQGSVTLMDDKFNEGLEALLVTEDRVCLRLLRAAATRENDIQYFTGAMTPTTVQNTIQQLTTWTLNANTMLLALDLISDINTGSAFSDYFDPVSKLEIILTGRLGTFLGTDIVTDGFRDPRLRVLDPGELFITANPEYVGQYTDRYGVKSEPRENDKDFPGRGWYMNALLSQAVGNTRAVASAKKI